MATVVSSATSGLHHPPARFGDWLWVQVSPVDREHRAPLTVGCMAAWRCSMPPTDLSASTAAHPRLVWHSLESATTRTQRVCDGKTWLRG